MRRRRETVEHPFGTIKARNGGDALPVQDAAQGRRRDGAARPRLQSDARDEHHGRPAVARRDQGVKNSGLVAALK